MFNPEKSTQKPREHYQRMVTMANAKMASLDANPFGNDPKIVEGWRLERDQSLTRAAKYIVDMVGKSDVEDLREAVAPENLKDVLQRGGAEFQVLMMVGEGREELDVLIKERGEQMHMIGMAVQYFTDENIKSILGRLWKKTQDAEAKLLPYEKKDVWSKLDAGYYVSFRQKFLEELENTRAMCIQYRETVNRGKK
ncbi:hypothetical protein HZC53_04845 [Candidatus Uhrbacteria bacterium]|nr:hypothetical protein [Candidatus Uhrbacteria bacterium]